MNGATFKVTNREPQQLSRRFFLFRAAATASVATIAPATTKGSAMVELLTAAEKASPLNPLLTCIRSFTHHTSAYQKLLQSAPIANSVQVPSAILTHYARAVSSALKLQNLARDPQNNSAVEALRGMLSCSNATSAVLPDFPDFPPDEQPDWDQIKWLLAPHRLKEPLRTVDVPSLGDFSRFFRGPSRGIADFMQRCDSCFSSELLRALQDSDLQIPRSFQNPFSSWFKLADGRSPALKGPPSPNRRSQDRGRQHKPENRDSADISAPLATIAQGYGEAAERPWSEELVAPPLCSASSLANVAPE